MLGLEGHKRKCNSSGLIDSLLAGIARGKLKERLATIKRPVSKNRWK